MTHVQKEGDLDIRTIAKLEEAVENAEAMKDMEKAVQKAEALKALEKEKK